jgi:para-aminobenzoate synthetase
MSLTLQIVDLIRADLHNISPSTSIEVPKLLQVESYETVHQVSIANSALNLIAHFLIKLVTTIQSQVAVGIGSVKVLERIFPPGSMTG